jgi:hypothetical protein
MRTARVAYWGLFAHAGRCGRVGGARHPGGGRRQGDIDADARCSAARARILCVQLRGVLRARCSRAGRGSGGGAEPAGRRRRADPVPCANFRRSDGCVSPMCRRLVGSAKDRAGLGLGACDSDGLQPAIEMVSCHTCSHINSIVPKARHDPPVAVWASEYMRSCVPTHEQLILACTWFIAFSTRFRTQVHACGQSRPVPSRPVGCTSAVYWIPPFYSCFSLQLMNISSTPYPFTCMTRVVSWLDILLEKK